MWIDIADNGSQIELNQANLLRSTMVDTERKVKICTGETNWMECAACGEMSGDLASTRRSAALFLDNLPRDHDLGMTGRSTWGAKWKEIGDAHCRDADLLLDRGAPESAFESWLCELTALEVANRIIGEDDPENAGISAQVEFGIQRFGSLLERKLERIQVPCCDEFELPAYYLPAAAVDMCAPAVICIGREEETGHALLGRLLPVVVGRGMSFLLLSRKDILNHPCGQSGALLSCCLDYLSTRPDIDASRIGVYGDGLSAALATQLAASDGRVAAAVCDGGLWNFARTLAYLGWMTTAGGIDEHAISARRSHVVRRLRCPVLVVAGGRGIVSVSEATKLEAECRADGIDLDVAIPRMITIPGGEIENYLACDDNIFGWLQHRFSLNPGSSHPGGRSNIHQQR